MSKQAELAVRFQEWQRAEQAVLTRRHQYLNGPSKKREKALRHAIRAERKARRRYERYRDKLRRSSR